MRRIEYVLLVCGYVIMAGCSSSKGNNDANIGGTQQGGQTNSSTDAGSGLGDAAVGGTAGTGGAWSTNPCATGNCITCPTTGGPAMVSLPLGYCIDSTEVSNSQYQQWLAANPDTAAQPSYCSWNTTFTPSQHWPPTADAGDLPVTYVDWCDAYAYCQGVGKRLCGKIGGGTNPYNDDSNPASSQWYAACTSNGTFDAKGYPYGATYSASACNGSDAKKGAPVAVGTMRECQSPVPGYTGVYDLSGNVWEWEDSCTASVGSSDPCRLRGGTYFGDSSYLICGGSTDVFLNRSGNPTGGIGFRCCYN